MCAFASGAQAAQPAFSGPDYSGRYACTGDVAKEGAYSATVTLELVPEHSTCKYGAYAFTLEVPGFGTYPGHAAAKGATMAIYFANTDPAPRDFGTGIATFAPGRSGRWSFTKFYYEPEFKGGNHGIERCALPP
jgi:hypothetical protein